MRLGCQRAPAGAGRWAGPWHPGPTAALVLVSPQSGRALFAGLVFASHREAKPARTRARGGGWQAKSVSYLVCARCGTLH
jgi:hypothetical protein